MQAANGNRLEVLWKVHMVDTGRWEFARKALIATALVWVLVSILVSAFRQHYTIGVDLNENRCLPSWLFLVKFEAKPIHALKRGDHVALIDREGLMGSRFKGELLGKQVMGIPGDVVEVRAGTVKVNGKVVGRLTLASKLNRTEASFDRVEVIPPGRLYLGGTEPRSYDSRYVGTFDAKSLVGTLTPLI